MDEVIVAVAKTVAELTSRQDGLIRQQLIEQLMREIMHYDAEFRRDDAAGRNRIARTALTKVGASLGASPLRPGRRARASAGAAPPAFPSHQN